jgi:hypothetical protein
MAILNGIQPTQIMRDNIQRGNSGAIGMWNENTGAINTGRSVPSYQRQPSPISAPPDGQLLSQPTTVQPGMQTSSLGIALQNQPRPILPAKQMGGGGWGPTPPPNSQLRYTAVMPRPGYTYIYNQQTGERTEVPIARAHNFGIGIQQTAKNVQQSTWQNPIVSQALQQSQSPVQGQNFDISSLVKMLLRGRGI